MSTRVADAFVAACLAELEAPKPGNVHRHAAGHGMTVDDFVRSAEAAAPALAARGAPVGERILRAVEATRAAVGQNTNLGIVLLCAPLAAAAERPGPLWDEAAAVLAGLTVADAVAAYRAIRLAGPGGLGRADEADVAAEPEVTLLAAMRLAAGRDRIAWNYANGLRDLREVGVPTLERLLARPWPEPWAVAGTYLAFLAAFPDTHVARKHGAEVAERVRARAARLACDLDAAADPEGVLPALLELDGEWKAARINPGTGADLVVASVFARGLGRHLPGSPANSLPGGDFAVYSRAV